MHSRQARRAARRTVFARRSRPIPGTRACIWAPAWRHTSNAATRTRERSSSVRWRSTRALTGARTALAEVQHRMGDVLAAISTLELASPTRPIDLPTRMPRATLDRWRREARAARSHAARDRLALHRLLRRTVRGGAGRLKRSPRSIAPTGGSARCWARFPPRRCRSCCTRPSSSATSRGRRRGRRARMTARFACRCGARSKASASSIACSRTNSPTRWSAASRRAACRPG